jgi:cell division protein FtsL
LKSSTQYPVPRSQEKIRNIEKLALTQNSKPKTGVFMTVAAETKVRQSDRITLRGGLKDFGFALLILLVLGAAIFSTVWRRVAFIEAGYEIRRLESTESKLLHLQHEMDIERAMLSSPERIEKVARARFGLKEPEPGQIRVLP